MSAYSDDRKAENWTTFVAVVFFVLGCFNLIDGIAALAQDDYFKVDELLFGDLSMWGVIYIVVALVQFVAGFLIFRRSAGGAILGVVLASLNAVVALLSIGAYPLWSVIILALDGVVIYALTVYGTDVGTAG